jgi:hypothetical protein
LFGVAVIAEFNAPIELTDTSKTIFGSGSGFGVITIGAAQTFLYNFLEFDIGLNIAILDSM